MGVVRLRFDTTVHYRCQRYTPLVGCNIGIGIVEIPPPDQGILGGAQRSRAKVRIVRLRFETTRPKSFSALQATGGL